MFHLVDAFAIFSVTCVGGRHVFLPTFRPQETLLLIGEWLALAVMNHLQHECGSVNEEIVLQVRY